MSNTIRYDALLVNRLAAELDHALRDRPVRYLRLDRAELRLHIGLDRDEELRWQLHPADGAVKITRSDSSEPGLRLPKKATIRAIHAIPDERVLIIELGGASAQNCVREIVIELITNQWNALALESGRRYVRGLRDRSETSRRQIRGQPYQPPVALQKLGNPEPVTLDQWKDTLRPLALLERRAAALQTFAWLSPLNVDAILGAATHDIGDTALIAAHERYARMLATESSPCWNHVDGHDQPYPVPLEGVFVRNFPSLLDAIAALDTVQQTNVEAEIARLLEKERARLQRLQKEAAEALGRAETLRSRANILLAYASQVKKGSSVARLSDFEGNPIEISIDPALNAIENANEIFDQARKRERAATRLPEVISECEARIAHFDQLHRKALGGGNVEGELRAIAPRALPSRAPEIRLPYRVYRSGSGLEIRVGRNSKDNDELTFKHSAPGDIWMHARDVAGAHVIVRWQNREGTPPRQDMIEAATLAALHSRARTSHIVPVDWTRRKYVRKPRRAPHGSVVLERVETIFVEVDRSLEERMK